MLSQTLYRFIYRSIFIQQNIHRLSNINCISAATFHRSSAMDARRKMIRIKRDTTAVVTPSPNKLPFGEVVLEQFSSENNDKEIDGESIINTATVGNDVQVLKKDEDDLFDEEAIIDEIIAQRTSGKTFANLLRNSKFIELGDFAGRNLIGTIVDVVADDLYIDFGGKFNTVCKRPLHGAERFIMGNQVVIRLWDWELSERFLGSKCDLTLLEADATLVRWHMTAADRQKQQMYDKKDDSNDY